MSGGRGTSLGRMAGMPDTGELAGAADLPVKGPIVPVEPLITDREGP